MDVNGLYCGDISRTPLSDVTLINYCPAFTTPELPGSLPKIVFLFDTTLDGPIAPKAFKCTLRLKGPDGKNIIPDQHQTLNVPKPTMPHPKLLSMWELTRLDIRQEGEYQAEFFVDGRSRKTLYLTIRSVQP